MNIDRKIELREGRKLNWRQACEMLNCSKSHFYNLINEGKIPAFRCGKVRGVWVWEADVRNYLELAAL